MKEKLSGTVSKSISIDANALKIIDDYVKRNSINFSKLVGRLVLEEISRGKAGGCDE